MRGKRERGGDGGFLVKKGVFLSRKIGIFRVKTGELCTRKRVKTGYLHNELHTSKYLVCNILYSEYVGVYYFSGKSSRLKKNFKEKARNYPNYIHS